MPFEPPDVEPVPVGEDSESGGWFWWSGGDGVYGYLSKFWQWMTSLPDIMWRLGGAMAKLCFMFLMFAIANTENMTRFAEKIPTLVEKALNLLTNIIGVGAGALSIVIPPQFLQGVAFANTGIPIESALNGLMALAGLYVIAILVRIIKNLLIVFR